MRTHKNCGGIMVNNRCAKCKKDVYVEETADEE